MCVYTYPSSLNPSRKVAHVTGLSGCIGRYVMIARPTPNVFNPQLWWYSVISTVNKEGDS